MRNSIIAVIFSLIYWSRGITADDDIKRGTFRFMGFIYYQDETVYDQNGARFMQGAVLIRQNFLISSSLVSSISADPLSKTLLARLGAIRIDTNFTLNEDEDEQEQEIVQVMQPISNRTGWWAADISLLRTLLPFKPTSAVQTTQLSIRQDYSDKICNILVFKKKGSSSDKTRYLTALSVEMLPSSVANCGDQFDAQTMACAADPQGSSVEDRSPEDFCKGNSGGPLICDNDVMALQTYIRGNCNAPHLYQLLAPWKKFLSCGTENYCGDNEKCPNVCSVILKDYPVTLSITSTLHVTTASTTASTAASTTVKATTESAAPETVPETTPTSTEASNEDTSEIENTTQLPTSVYFPLVETSLPSHKKTSNSSSKNDTTSKPISRTAKISEKKTAKQRVMPVQRSIVRHSSSTCSVALRGLVFNSLIACLCLI